MALGFISYSVENDEAFKKQVASALEVVGDLRIPFKTIARDFRKSRKAIFKLKSSGQYPDFQGDSIGKTWKNPGRPQLRTRNPSYTPYQWQKERKTDQKGGYPLLKFTGRLERSITEEGGEHIEIIDKTVLAIGTSVPYAEYHQSDASRSKIPLRKFLFIGPEAGNVAKERGTLDRWSKIIQDYVVRKMNAALGAKVEKGGSENV